MGNDSFQTSIVPIVRDFHPMADLQLARNKKVVKQIELSVCKSKSRPVLTGVFQMQNNCGGALGIQSNLEKMLKIIALAGQNGIQILAFPEMCLQGYFTPESGSAAKAFEENARLAIDPENSKEISRLCKAAARANLVIIFGFAEKSKSGIFNSAGVIDADGRWLGLRRKNPLYPYDHETLSFATLKRSKRSSVFQTKIGRIGVSICFDGEFAESVRHMRIGGAELLVWINAALGDSILGTSQRSNTSGAYAHGNGIWVMCVNCVAPDSSGMSCIYSLEGEPLIILSSNREELGIAKIDLSMDTLWRDIWNSRIEKKIDFQ